MSLLPDSARIGIVSLTVSDLDRSVRFYEDHLWFKLHKKDVNVARLGAGGADFLELVEDRSARPAYRTTGLYHFAVLVPSRRHLGLSLRRLGEMRTPVQGFADHLVSEAIYLPDPDGNGIEIYRDRPRQEWPRLGDGSIRMANAPLDVDGILAELGAGDRWTGLAPETVIGHMHLHVSQLDLDEVFYRDVVGLDFIMRFGSSASFLSAGGYHHHLGINTWAGVGAPPPPPGSVGLRWFELLLPDAASLEAVSLRLESASHDFHRSGDLVEVTDHSGNGLRIALSAV